MFFDNFKLYLPSKNNLKRILYVIELQKFIQINNIFFEKKQRKLVVEALNNEDKGYDFGDESYIKKSVKGNAPDRIPYLLPTF